jgi:DNA-binding NarL/FixJ family response regulator
LSAGARPDDSAAMTLVPIKLTPREEAIVQSLLSAHSNKDIARELGISEQSVKNRLTILYKKFGVNSRLQLMRAFLKHPKL